MSNTRPIYLSSSDDQKLYNKAKKQVTETHGSMSSFILDLIRKYMNNPNGEGEIGYVSYLIYTGESGKFKKKIFKGMYLTSETIKVEGLTTEVQIFLTKKQNILVYRRSTSVEGEESAEYEVYDYLEEVVNVSPNLIALAQEKINIEESEELDV